MSKVNIPTKYIFNRILAGTFSRDRKTITTTHSYYDCSNIKDFISLANQYGLDCLIEAHTEKELERAINIGYPIIGINTDTIPGLCGCLCAAMD